MAYTSSLVMQLLSSKASGGDNITKTRLLNQAAPDSLQKISLKADQHHHRLCSTAVKKQKKPKHSILTPPCLDLFLCLKIHQLRPFYAYVDYQYLLQIKQKETFLYKYDLNITYYR